MTFISYCASFPQNVVLWNNKGLASFLIIFICLQVIHKVVSFNSVYDSKIINIREFGDYGWNTAVQMSEDLNAQDLCK